MNDNKTQLLKLIDTLSESQITYALTLLKKLFGRS